jgi:serine/threonine-protein kinase
VNTAVADPLVGRVLEGRYKIQAQLARGGMSTVYVAKDERLDRLVAVKVMAATLSADPAFTDRFIREARAAARLTHTNAVSVYDQGEEAGTLGRLVFLVMEYVSGRTVRDLLRERGRLSPAEAVSIIEPVLAALAAAHSAGLVHRDVKPENILLSDDGVVKVADFGLARAIETTGNATATGIMMGTVAYCSPEQISRARTDARSDVYSTGIVLYELLTGTPPYVGDSAVNVAFQHVHNRVPAPSTRTRGIHPELDELVLRATDSDPAGRPIDAGAFLAELTDVRTDLDLPVVAVRGMSAAKARRDGRGYRADAGNGRGPAGGAAEHPTDPLGRRGPHQTGATQTIPASRPAPERDLFADEGPPPPVVIPPPKTKKVRSPRSRRRRRALILVIVLVLLGASAGYGGWWFAAGRFARVPSVNGQSPGAATAALRHAGFNVTGGVQSQFSDTVAKGAVIATDPPGGSRVPRGNAVTLIVSEGKDVVTIPSVARGSTVAQARVLLGSVDLQIETATATQPSDTIPADAVIATSPAGGASVPRNSLVQIIVSSGPPSVEVPDESNKSQSAATADLKAQGFVVGVTQDYNPVIAAGTVISTTPAAGTMLTKFKTVTIDVSKGPAPVTLPQIASGTPLKQARAQLEGMGFVVKVTEEFGGHLDEVVGMDPAAGKTVPYGSTVTLYVV